MGRSILIIIVAACGGAFVWSADVVPVECGAVSLAEPRFEREPIVAAESVPDLASPWRPDAEERFRHRLGLLSDGELFGRRHIYGRAGGKELQRSIDRRLANYETLESFCRMRTLFHMMIIRECQLEELARREHEKSWFGKIAGGTSALLGPGFSRAYDGDLRHIRAQRRELENLYFWAVVLGDDGDAASAFQSEAGVPAEALSQVSRPHEGL